MDHDPGSTGPLSVLEGPVVPADESRQLSSRRRYLARLHRLTGGVFGPAPSTRLAATAHGATLLGAFAFWVWLDRGLWFFGDEWDFLVRRGLSYPPASHRSIWFPHNEHWSTLPILLWRGLYNVFHLSSYWPYLIPLLLAGVVVMHLAWRLCRRAGVDPWVATAAVGLLGFLGAGAEDLSSAFQIGFVASVLFGFVALDLLDRPMNSPAARRMMSRRVPASMRRGILASRRVPASMRRGILASRRVPASTRRGILASLAMLASLMCSTVGDAMVVGSAVFLFARRPPKRALAVLALPVTSYAVWFTFLGRPAVSAPGDHFSLVTFTSLPSYVWFGLSSALGQAFNLPSAGAALLVGLAAWVTWNMRSVWQECPSLLGLGAAGITFYILAGLGRDMTVGASTIVSRYVYVGIAILLPVMAKALSSAGAGPAARAVVIAFLAVTTLGNVGQAETWVTSRIAVTSSLKTQLVATGRLLVAGVRDVSGPGASPIGLFPDLSAERIEQLARSGRLPDATITQGDLVNARGLLAAGTWNGSKTALLPEARFTGRFAFIRTVRSATSMQANGCLDFAPETISPAMQVWLRIPPGQRSASVRVSAAPASPGVTNYVAATLVPPSGPASTNPVQLAIPSGGTGYLDDNDAQAELVLLWGVGTPLELCGLSVGPGGE